MRPSPVSHTVLTCRPAVASLLAVALGLACGEPGDRTASEGARAEADFEASGGNSPHPAEIRGDSLYRVAEFDAAREAFDRALAEARDRRDSYAEARILTSLGLTAYRLGNYQAARRRGEEALALKVRRELDPLLFRSYNALGLLAWNEARYYEAADLLESAFRTAEATADTGNLARVSTNLGLLLVDLGEFRRAREYYLSALDGARSVGDAFIEGRVLNNLGALQYQIGSARSAIEYLEAARLVFAEAGDEAGDVNALGQLGTAYGLLGSPGRALAYLDSALTRARELGLRYEEASDLQQLASVYRETGDLHRALSLLAEASDINAELDLGFEQGAALRQTAGIYSDLSAHDIAIDAAEAGLVVHRELGARGEELSDLLLLANLAEEAGLPARSARYLEAADSLAELFDLRAARVEAAVARARIAEKRGQSSRVLEALRGVTEDLQESGYLQEWESHSLRARAFASLGSLDEAEEAGWNAIRAAERVRGTLASAALRSSFLAQRQSTYFDLTMVLHSAGRIEEAFQVADGARGRALIEHLLAAAPENGRSEVAAGNTVQALVRGEQLLREIDQLLVRLDDLEKYPPEQGAEELERELRSELRRRRADYEAILTQVALNDPDGITLLGGGRVDPGALVDALQGDEALVQYLIGPEHVLLFALSDQGLRIQTVEVKREALAARIRLARDLLSRPSVTAAASPVGSGTPVSAGRPEAGQTVLRHLHDLLIKPLLEDGAFANVRRLIIVPHAELTYVPFSALVDSASGRYLAQDYELLHLPSSSVLSILRNRAKEGERVEEARPVAFAPFPTQLPATAAEVAAIARSLEDARIQRGRRATEVAFRESLSNPALIHAATHGVLNARNPMFSRVELAPGSGAGTAADGWLEVRELFGLSVKSTLVFLSGCQTGLGTAWSTDFAHGEDYATLAQAFLYAGAANVVATLWRIEDDGAAVFAEHFYREIRNADSPTAALAAARRSMIEDPKYNAPFYWAAYRLTGSGTLRAPLSGGSETRAQK